MSLCPPRVWLAVLLLHVMAPGHAAPPRVVVSVAPVHSLVAAVMRERGQPELLLPPGASPHQHALRPSQARALETAELVVWVGAPLEAFLARAPPRPSAQRRVLTLMDAPGIQRLPARSGGVFAPSPDGSGSHAHPPYGPGATLPGLAATADGRAHAGAAPGDRHAAPPASEAHPGVAHQGDDPHLWLDPANARAIIALVAAELEALDPAHGPRYRANAAAAVVRVETLDAELTALLAPVREVPYLVFHDAYQGFERHYGLRALGSVTVTPGRAPGARRLSELRHLVTASRARCVFREPQFPPRMVDTLLEGTAVRTGVLDPLGVDIAPGPDAWFRLMRALAGGLRDCLYGGS